MKLRNFLSFVGLTMMLVFLFPGKAYSQYQLMKKGEKAYDNGEYKQAMKSYYLASKGSENLHTDYNLGNALSKSGEHKEAVYMYSRVIDSTDNKKLKADAYYNMGNNLLALKKYKEGLQAYKNALRLNPQDKDARENLMYVKRILKKQEQQQQQNKSKNQNKKQERQQQQNQRQGQNNQNQKQQQKSEEQQKKNPGSQKKENQNQRQQSSGNQEQGDSTQGKNAQDVKKYEGAMNKLEAERILQMIQKRDEHVWKNFTKKKGGARPSTKKW